MTNPTVASTRALTPGTPARRLAAGATVVLPWLLMAVAFALLFAKPATLLVRDWWTDPESGHGLLLAPAALWLAWRLGLQERRRGNRALGTGLVALAVVIRVTSELAAELYTMRGSMFLAMIGLVVFFFGVKQLLAWWLPAVLLILTIPLPELVRSAIALPLQFKASQLGAAMLEWRHVPVQLSGNIIQIPGQRLFVTEACSGLRSLTALISLAVLMGGIWMSHPVTRVALLVLAIPIAVVINGVRVFLTGFLVFFVDPAMGKGFMHLTEGWLLFLVSFTLVTAVAMALRVVERAVMARDSAHG